MDFDTLIADAQKVVDGLKALKASQVTVTEVDVKESDGSEVVAAPEVAPAA